MTQVCFNGAYVLGLVSKFGDTVAGPCPVAVRYSNGKVQCDVVLHPNKYIKKSNYSVKVLRRNFAHLIGSGFGCDKLYDEDDALEETKLQQILENMQNNSEWVKKSKIAIEIIHGISI